MVRLVLVALLYALLLHPASAGHPTTAADIYDRIQPSPTAQQRSCLAKPTQRTFLAELLFSFMQLKDPTAVRMLVKGWATHRLNSAITRILLLEVIGLPAESLELKSTEQHITVGSFRALSMDGSTPPTADLDMELWASAAYGEYEAFMGKYVNAGPTFNRARSGLFLRPSPADHDMLVNKGRSYLNLVEHVLPTLPTVSTALASGWCGASESEHCVEMPNRACYDKLGTADECKALLKGSNAYDAGIVEEMIKNASLPLAIVYTGWAEPSIFASAPNQSLLFYYFEPDALIGQGSSFLRVDFETPAACVPQATHLVFSPNKACDFIEGLVHKGLSERIKVQYPDVEHMIRNYGVPSNEMVEMQELIQSSSTLTEYDVACEWVKSHEHVWKGWLLRPMDQTPDYLQYLPGVALLTACILALAWCTYPAWGATPSVGSHWSAASNWLKPKTPIGIVILAFRSLCRASAKIMQRLRHVAEVGPRVACGMLRAWLRKRLSSYRSGSRSGSSSRVAPDGIDQEPSSRRDTLRRSSSSLHSYQVHNANKQSRANRKRHLKQLKEREERENQTYEDKMYDSAQDAAAALVQGLFRSRGDMTAAKAARTQMRARTITGAQFASAETYGLEGTVFHIAVFRGPSANARALTLKVKVAQGIETNTAESGRDFLLLDDTVTFGQGECFASVAIEALYNGVSNKANEGRAWLPVRECTLQLELSDHGHENGRHCIGMRQSCKVFLVDCDAWPSTEASEKGESAICWEYFISTFRENLTNEMWWLIGSVYRKVADTILTPICIIIIIEVAAVQRRIDWAFVFVPVLLLIDVLKHVTSYWYPSSWMMGYNVAMSWVLSKWMSLPLRTVLDSKVHSRFRVMVQLIDDEFFNHNDYSVFANMLECVIEYAIVLVAPFFLFGFRAGDITQKEILIFSSNNMMFPVLLTVLNVVLGVLWFVTGKVSPSTYLESVRKWIEMEGAFVERINSLFSDYLLHRSFKKRGYELEKTLKHMGETRGESYSFHAKLEASGRGYEWVLTLVKSCVMLSFPVVLVLVELSVSQLVMLHGFFAQGQALLSMFSDVRERLRVSKKVLSMLAGLLNEGRDALMQHVHHSRLQYSYVRRAAKHYTAASELQFEINFYRVRYGMGGFIKSHSGLDFQLAVDGRIPLGGVVGLTAHTATGSSVADSGVLDVQNRLLLHLIGGLASPTDGAIVLPPHVIVGIVPAEPQFVANQTLLENLRYGCGTSQPEETVWLLCSRLGLPEVFFCTNGGDKPMGSILFQLSPLEKILASLVRTILAGPTVVLVHDQGFLSQDAAAKIGLVLQNYVDGIALTRLGEPRGNNDSQGAGQQGSRSPTPTRRSSVGTPNLRRSSSNGSSGSLDELSQSNANRVDKKTVIWHSDQATLHKAGISQEQIYTVIDGQLHAGHGAVSASAVHGRGLSPSITPSPGHHNIIAFSSAATASFCTASVRRLDSTAQSSTTPRMLGISRALTEKHLEEHVPPAASGGASSAGAAGKEQSLAAGEGDGSGSPGGHRRVSFTSGEEEERDEPEPSSAPRDPSPRADEHEDDSSDGAAENGSEGTRAARVSSSPASPDHRTAPSRAAGSAGHDLLLRRAHREA